MTNLDEIRKRSKELVNEDLELAHSSFQMDFFITGKNGITLYGQYKQSLRELRTRENARIGLECRHETNDIDLEECRMNLETEKNRFERRRLEVKIKRYPNAQEGISQDIKENEREYRRFYNQAEQLKEKLGTIDEEQRNAYEVDYWVQRLSRDAHFEKLEAASRISRSTLSNMHSLPKAIREHILKEQGVPLLQIDRGDKNE